jgi:hypothetical protein
MNRGDRREPIYAGNHDRLLFLDTLAEACEKTEWQVHAFAQDLQGRRESAPQQVRIARI